jgi:hypothetical protein
MAEGNISTLVISGLFRARLLEVLQAEGIIRLNTCSGYDHAPWPAGTDHVHLFS